MKEKVRTITSRIFLYLFCHRVTYFKSNKKYEQSVIFDVDIKSGSFIIELEDLVNNKIEKLDNPSLGIYEYPLKKDNRYRIKITSKGACGKYKIQKKTLIFNGDK